MPRRYESFVQNGIYHIYNKAIEKTKIFTNQEVGLFINILVYYRSSVIQQRYSDFLVMDVNDKKDVMAKILSEKSFYFDCYSYCFMPNHFHLLLKQRTDTSLSQILRKVLISFTRCYNQLKNRQGPLFLPQFKTVEIFNEEQFKHVSRYIELNPYSSGLVRKIIDLKYYPFSSFKYYVTKKKSNLCSTDFILDLFNHNLDSYQRFVFDQADYQRSLEIIKKSRLL